MREKYPNASTKKNMTTNYIRELKRHTHSEGAWKPPESRWIESQWLQCLWIFDIIWYLHDNSISRTLSFCISFYSTCHDFTSFKAWWTWARAGKAVLLEVRIGLSWFVGFIARFCNLLHFPNSPTLYFLFIQLGSSHRTLSNAPLLRWIR